jgi:hypothetical protein
MGTTTNQKTGKWALPVNVEDLSSADRQDFLPNSTDFFLFGGDDNHDI